MQKKVTQIAPNKNQINVLSSNKFNEPNPIRHILGKSLKDSKTDTTYIKLKKSYLTSEVALNHSLSLISKVEHLF